MAKQLYPDMDYQEEVYNQLVSDFSGVDFKKSETYNLPTNSKRCICPNCGEHSANFFRAKDNNTFLMTCMRGCGLKKTIHELVMDHGKPELKEEVKKKEVNQSGTTESNKIRNQELTENEETS